ncbi:MAG: tetratricopeptide repeat protein [Alphaproteobacteria bacterium]|nr:tetratricopeptide repeat protein [Alphaproteobacteria bacterium]
MRQVLRLALVVAACAGGAFASAYDDFSRGVNAINRNQPDVAIAAFTAALNAGDLAAGYVPNAHMGRARAYLFKGKCAEALADLDAVLAAKPNDVQALTSRGGAYACLKKPDAATADFNRALALQPSAGLYEAVGHYQWQFSRFAEAARDFAQAVKLAPEDAEHGPYLVIWYFISADRGGTLDPAVVKDGEKRFDSRDWPRPILQFFDGKIAVEKVFELAADRDATTATNQKCEADFYVAEWQLARKNPDAAKPLLQQARAECPHNFIEYFAAQTEIDRP